MSLASQRQLVSDALLHLGHGDLREPATSLFAALGYRSARTLETGGQPSFLLNALGIPAERFDLSRWKSLELLFQLTGDELPALSRGASPAAGAAYESRTIESFVFLALDLNPGAWSRRELVQITRDLNRDIDMPAILLFRYSNRATLAVIDRRQNLRDTQRDVIGGRISLVKDIDLEAPHRAHVDILLDLSLTSLKAAPTSFRVLYDAWLLKLSASELNKRFYRELADWFAWASTEGVVHFPPGQGNKEGERQTGLIRLLTRLMFVWFIKQKGLIPADLFATHVLGHLLKENPQDHPEAHGYYLSVLQNLFFACLNTEDTERNWLPGNTPFGLNAGYLVHNKLRQQLSFQHPDKALALFRTVPFLNGGLFDCLDEELEPTDVRGARAAVEGRGSKPVLRVDGFSEKPERQPRLPNRLFFGGMTNADLSKYYGKPTRRTVKGLIDLFDSYKFTIEENTPLEEEAALDPELLGKVFENLLASYNDDTRTTARNKSGSFYTPREVVDFMVDEALVPYLAPYLAAALETSDNEKRVRALLSYSEEPSAFTDAERDTLIEGIEQCKAIDPAVGSGAFPLGLLQKLVHVLHRLDPDNSKWKARNRLGLERDLSNAEDTPSPSDRSQRVADAHRKLVEFDASFSAGTADYTRKLYLIEGCLYGVDIQPIAIQIAKLRCFIALAVEQKVDDALPNRGITPLPNLEMKFVAANALGISAKQGQLRTPDVLELEQALRNANRRLFAARNRTAKKVARERILRLRDELSEALVRNGHPAEDARALAQWNPFNANAAATFFDPEWMFGLDTQGGEGCFDLALANPPYVRQEKIESYEIDGKPANSKVRLRNYETFTSTADLYVYFYERSIRLLRPNGVLSFITSSRWYRAGYGAKLRSWIKTEMRLRCVIDFGDAEVFEAIAYPTIVVASRRPERQVMPDTAETFLALSWVAGDAPDGFPARFARDAFQMPQASLLNSGWQFEEKGKRDLLAHLRNKGQPLSDWCQQRIYYGIKTGLNEAFVIDGAKRAELIEADPGCAAIIKPFLRGRDVKRWQVEPEDQWLIKIESSENVTHTWSGKSDDAAEAIFAAAFPSIYQWWEVEGLRESLLARSDQGKFFWELRSCAYWETFESSKVVIPAIQNHTAYAADNFGFFSNDKTSIIVTERWRFLLAFLNSSVSWWMTQQEFATKQGGYYEFKPMYVGRLPVPAVATHQEAMCGYLVDTILAGAQPRSLFESLLNAFVYELFFPEELAAHNLSPFQAAEDAALAALAQHTDDSLAREASAWSRHLTDPARPLYATLFALQSIDVIRIIEGR